MESTNRLALPLISAGQAQKEVLHNEALLRLDTIVAAAVEEPPLDSPPATAASGDCFIVGTSPTGDWADYPDHLAGYSQAGWRFVAPLEGMTVQVRSSATSAVYRDGGWEIGTLRGSSLILEGTQVIGAQAAAIADPSGGATVDAEARTALSSVLSALRQHGLIAT